MKSILVAAVVGLVVSILVTPFAINVFRKGGIGQEIRIEGPKSHQTKRGTPTMGGTVIVLASLLGYFVSHLLVAGQAGRGPTASGLLAIYLLVGLGVVGFLDDFIKLNKRRNLGLTKSAKLIAQIAVAVSFAVLSRQFKNADGLTPASSHLSFVRDIGPIGLGVIGFVIFALLWISAFSNAVNFTDGLDGLAAGSAAMVYGAYVVITFYQFRNGCGGTAAAPGCYTVRDPFDLALVAAAVMGACFGFLWWNAHPARIIMGDTGSLPLGGVLAGIALLSRTDMLLIILGGLFVVELLSDVIQIAVFKTRRRRVFKMAPIHHHFELAGWKEMTIIVRFWIISGLAVAFGLGTFYAEFISKGLP
ncbi:MAG: phospho-N-acetylmuramoyl-pentapeptide-transferase [Mycobacteriales bacterium]